MNMDKLMSWGSFENIVTVTPPHSRQACRVPFVPRQVHQLKQGTHVGCGLPTLFNITDITNSLAEQHFKVTRWVLGKSLEFNTGNWLAFPLKYKAFDK